MKLTRYPGLHSFTEDSKEMFFGRNQDVEKLYTLINNEELILLFSKSGVGKSSIINAGIIPKLRNDNKFKPVTVRFNAWIEKSKLSLTDKIVASLDIIKGEGEKVKQNMQNGKWKVEDNSKSYNSVSDSTFLDELGVDNNSLWYHFKSKQIKARLDDEIINKNSNYILFFDQFEELFSYPNNEILEFKKQMAELIYTDIPARYRTELKNITDAIPDYFSEKQMDVLYEKPRIRFVFAIRSDKLSLLDKVSDFLPTILKKRYELKSLNQEQARNAIIMPAQASGDFKSNSFEYSEEALNHIMDYLGQKGEKEIETTQLQLVCERIEDIVLSEMQYLEKPVIKKEIIPEFKDIFFDFYNLSIEKLAKNRQDKSRRLVENELIRNGQRISLDRLICHDYIQDGELQILVNSRLLRAEPNTTGGISYELSHDTLVAPILEAKKTYEEKVEEARSEAERQEELQIAKEKAEKERIENEKKRKRQRQIIFIVSIAAIVSIAFGIFGIVNMKTARKEQARTKQLTITGNLRDANAYVEREEYEVAYKKYILLRDTILEGNTTPAIEKRINKCLKLDSISKLFYSDLDKIDSLIKSNIIDDLQKASNLFKHLKSLEYEPGKTKQKNRLKTYHLQINAIINERLRIAESMINAGLHDDAIKYIIDIEKLDIDNKQIKEFKEKHNIQ